MKYKFYFIFVAFNLLVTFPTIWFTFKETTQLTLEEIDLLFEETAPDTVAADVAREGRRSESLRSPVEQGVDVKFG